MKALCLTFLLMIPVFKGICTAQESPKQSLFTIAGSKKLIANLVTHKFPLTEAEEAFKLQISGNCGKDLLNPVE